MFEKFNIEDQEEDKLAIMDEDETERNTRIAKNGGFASFNKFMSEALFNESPVV